MKNGELEINNGLPTGWAYAGLEDISDVDRHSIKRGPFGSALKKEFFVTFKALHSSMANPFSYLNSLLCLALSYT